MAAPLHDAAFERSVEEQTVLLKEQVQDLLGYVYRHDRFGAGNALSNIRQHTDALDALVSTMPRLFTTT